MNIDDFIKTLKQGREIEFCFNKKEYFMQPDYDNSNTQSTCVVLYECLREDECNKIFIGKIEDFMVFEFEQKYTLKDNFDMLEIKFIL